MPAKPVPDPDAFGHFAVFVDGSGHCHTARELGMESMFRCLLDNFRTQGRLNLAHCYTALPEGDLCSGGLIN